MDTDIPVFLHFTGQELISWVQNEESEKESDSELPMEKRMLIGDCINVRSFLEGVGEYNISLVIPNWWM